MNIGNHIPAPNARAEQQVGSLLPATRSGFIARYPLTAFFLLAYLSSWMVEIPIALSVQGVIAIKIPLALHYLAAFGPCLAALIVTRVCDGDDTLH